MAIGAIVGPVIGLLGGLLGGGHAKAVKKEQATIGAAVPVFEQKVQQISQNYSSGMRTLEETFAELDAAEKEFNDSVASIRKGPTTGEGDPCNAACWYGGQVHSSVEVVKKNLQVKGQAVTGKVSQTVSQALNVPGVKPALYIGLPVVGLLVVGYFVFRMARRR